MKDMHKIGLLLLVIATIAYIKIAYFNGSEQKMEEETIIEKVIETPDENKNDDGPKSYVNVFFIAQNDNKEEVYRAVKREYNAKTDGSKLNFAIKTLLKGPSIKEKSKGAYSEIPSNTRLLSIEETPDKISINLSGDFENGGGTESIYKRLYQLIKTSTKNTSIPVYLYINGKQTDVVGGEGIMINQPLGEKSLN